MIVLEPTPPATAPPTLIGPELNGALIGAPEKACDVFVKFSGGMLDILSLLSQKKHSSYGKNADS